MFKYSIKKYMNIVIILIICILIVALGISIYFNTRPSEPVNKDTPVLSEVNVSEGKPLPYDEEYLAAQEEAKAKAEKIAKEQFEKAEKERLEQSLETAKNPKNNQSEVSLFNSKTEEKINFKFHPENFDTFNVTIKEEESLNLITATKNGKEYQLYICIPYVLYSSDDFKYKLDGYDIYYTDVLEPPEPNVPEGSASSEEPEKKSFKKYFVGIQNFDGSALLVETTNDKNNFEKDIVSIIKSFGITPIKK